MRATWLCGRGVPVWLLFAVVVGNEFMDWELRAWAREMTRER